MSQNLFWFWTIFYQFLLLHLAPLLWSSSSLFAFYIGDFGWAAPLWLPWPWISEGEKELLRSQMRSSPPNFPFILFNFEYWIIIVDHFQVMVMMECHRERRTSRQTRSGWANSPNYCCLLKKTKCHVCRCDWSIFDLLNHATNIWSSPLKFVNCSCVSNDMHNQLYKSLNNIFENPKLTIVVWVISESIISKLSGNMLVIRYIII